MEIDPDVECNPSEVEAEATSPTKLTIPYAPRLLPRKGIAHAPAEHGTIDPRTQDILLQAIARSRAGWTRSSPGADAMRHGWLASIIKLGAVLGLSSVILVSLLGQPRIFYSMARDGLLPPFAAIVHQDFAALCYDADHWRDRRDPGGSIGLAGELVSIGTLFAVAVVCLSLSHRR